MKKMVYQIPGVKPMPLAVGTELYLEELYRFENKKSMVSSSETPSGVIQRIDRNSFHIRLEDSFRLPLYHFLVNDRLFIGKNLSPFLAVGADKIDPHYLIELEYFGFSIERKSLLKDVKMLFPADDVVISAQELIWLDDDLLKHPGLKASLVKPQSQGESLYNLLPAVATSLFSPFDHVFYAQFSQQIIACEDPILEVGKQSLPKNFGFGLNRADVFNGAHKSGVVEGINLKTHVSKIKRELETGWEATGREQSLETYLAEGFYYPFTLFQLNILAAEAGKEVRLVDSEVQKDKADAIFTMDDDPIVNVYESFQRVFFYGNQWLSRVWFFIPPMISAKIIKRQYKYSSGEQHICIYALTLDYLLRFYPLKVGNVTGD
ncbi:hypothetical protein [uncultured Microbulbifer sp.]|uniref:hypothetical protein n=1 Tax=uncultured Microbulbifer sp. TaxID=348147 RepID=UPI00261665DD|nr:hypothetical protein [uncultured Microbulbifer sp.]